MAFALVVDGNIVRRFADLPARHWVAESPTSGHYERVTVGNAAGYGYLPVVEADRPADTASTTWDRTVTITATEVATSWTERPKSQAELDADVDDRERQQIAGVVGELGDYIIDDTVTAADAIAQTKLHARILRRLIRDRYVG